MSKAREDAVIRITAQFVADYEANRHPRLDEYIRRYPRYATEITAFVSYYYALEADLPSIADAPPPLSAASRAALNQAWSRAEETRTTNQPPLFELASHHQFTPSQLARALDLSQEIATRLALRQFALATLPPELLLRLTNTLDEPVERIKQALEPGSRQVAEVSTLYTSAAQSSPALSTFRLAIEADRVMSPASKAFWLGQLDAHEL